MCHQRWQTMLNRGWSASVTCGSRMLYICSASKMSNIIVPLRGTYHWGCTFRRLRPKGACQRLSMAQRLRRFFSDRPHACKGAQDANYLNLQPLRGCVYWGDCCYPHVADCASLIVNMGLLRLQPLCGCASGCNNSRPLRTPDGGG